jgi:hypothetical protein
MIQYKAQIRKLDVLIFLLQKHYVPADDNVNLEWDFVANCGGTVAFEDRGVIQFNPRLWPWHSSSYNKNNNNSSPVEMHCLGTVRSTKNSDSKFFLTGNSLGPHASLTLTPLAPYLNFNTTPCVNESTQL